VCVVGVVSERGGAVSEAASSWARAVGRVFVTGADGGRAGVVESRTVPLPLLDHRRGRPPTEASPSLRRYVARGRRLGLGAEAPARVEQRYTAAARNWGRTSVVKCTP